MSNRFYRLILGVALVFSLYFDVNALLYALIGLTTFEAVTKSAPSKARVQETPRQ